MSAEDRIQLQAQENPDFRYDALYEFITDKKGELWVVVKAFIWRTEADTLPWVTGLAAEAMTTQFAIEKAETSAYARAVTNTGITKFSTTKSGRIAPRANREEMEKVARAENDGVTVKIQADLSNDWENFLTDAPTPPTTLRQGVEMVSNVMSAKVIQATPKCAHGDMARKEGISAKTNKPYGGWVCQERGNDQCDPIWDKK